MQANPKTLIDVGAAFGTPGLYDAFPEAYRVLIGPLTESEPELWRHTTNGKGEYHLVAAGAESGEATITMQHSKLTKSSFHERTALTATSGKARQGWYR